MRLLAFWAALIAAPSCNNTREGPFDPTCGQCVFCTSTQTQSNPNLTPSRTVTLTLAVSQPCGGLEVGRGGGVAPPRVSVTFFRKNVAGPKAGLGQSDRGPARFSLQLGAAFWASVVCRGGLFIVFVVFVLQGLRALFFSL